MSIPLIPKIIKVQTAYFMKEYVYKYYFSTFNMINNNLDKQTIKQMITQSGYEYQEIEVETEDGYIINMNRICNKESYNAVYFQHGVLDNSLTWVVHGPSDSIAYQAHESGFDVFMGNFRGVYPRKLVKGKDPKSYWEYSLDELAKYDVQAFIQKIRDIKIKELMATYIKISKLSEEEIIKDIESRLTITYVGHSLGGMTLPMYIINQRIRQRPHYLTNAILLSPAGIHTNAPIEVGITGWIFTHILAKLISHVAIPKSVVSVFQKIHRDLRGLPAARDLFTFISSSTLGGNKIGDSPVWKSAKIVQSFLQFGFSRDLGIHFYTNWKQNKFQAFDFGKKKNIAMYGTEKPFNYLDHYHLIDIPIHFFISLNDTLIRADDIVEHYHTLKKHQKNLAHMKLFEGFSHVDFTYQSHHVMMHEIITTLKKCQRKQIKSHEVQNNQQQSYQQKEFIDSDELSSSIKSEQLNGD
ncbi:ab-hydrolase associated lipase region containing protein [Stylonychia lemnae]|uniref:Ab-hydrolase associated lipase region containing protein n=1 Tax=Stylonychia lemnae TaxID=5949 RepID=A0A078A9U8_STYLE|nr:ab-hydrolase associated lipase region containing protein [Stylonychia lemnae]|eukprot:CDW78671.1 ab-hydrolase associated lipase region containing protein [Stylonychia lemnae]